MNHQLASLACLAILGVVVACNEEPVPSAAKQDQDLPNIVYILADDLGYGDLGIYNPESKIATPNIDSLARAGIYFTDAHAPASVCTPTRYAILTGEYGWRSRLPKGVLRGYGRSLIEREQLTVPGFLQEGGYTTGVVGKWHLGLDWIIKAGHEVAFEAESTQINEVGMISEMDPEYIDFSQKPSDGPLNHGFDYSFILPASLDMPPYCYLEQDSLVSLPDSSTIGNDLNTGYTGAFWRPGLIASGFEFDQVLPTFTRKATDFIGKASQKNNPFFLYLPFAAPHTPWVPTSTFQGKSSAASYGDFVQMVDAAVGELMEALEANGVSENTLVIFTSDNGPFWTPELIDQYKHKAAGALRGMKADAWEGGHRVPFIVRWPGVVEGGRKSDALTTLTNLLATVIDLLGVLFEVPPSRDSYSILPILMDETEVGQPFAIHHSSRNFFAIRKGNWKLIEGRGSGGFSKPLVYEPKPNEAKGQLYNLKEDLKETNNLYQKHPEIVQELQALLKEVQGRN